MTDNLDDLIARLRNRPTPIGYETREEAAAALEAQRTELAEANVRIENLLGEQVAGIYWMREAEAARAAIAEAAHP